MRQSILAMEPYAWEASSASIAKERGLKQSQIVRFDTNTSPHVLQAVKTRAEELGGIGINEYPAPDYAALVDAVAQYAKVDASQVVMGAGADEVIDTVAKTFLEPGCASVIFEPTYSMFRVCSQTYGAEIIEAPRDEEFALDVEALADAANDAALVWACNPNSPTGNAEPVEKIRELLERVECTVVVDEAYAEYWGQSVLPLLTDFKNLIVVRTLSKAFGLAGARVGYAVTNEKMAALLNKVRLPNSVSAPSAELAQAALSPDGVRQMKANVAAVTSERRRVEVALAQKFSVWPSVANFLLVDLGDAADQTVSALLEPGLVVRNLSQKPQTRGCIRITIRSAEENNRLLEALA